MDLEKNEVEYNYCAICSNDPEAEMDLEKPEVEYNCYCAMCSNDPEVEAASSKMKPQQLLMKISLSLIRKWRKLDRKMLSKTKLTSFLNHSLISRRNTGFSKRNSKSKVVSSLKFTRN